MQAIRHFFEQRQTSARLVLATVYETAGSTYSKAGERMLIDGNGEFQGMLSGGCLEGDLAERARNVIDSGEAVSVTYDMRGEDDVLLGLGVGCEGMMRVLLQPLDREQAFRPFPDLLSVFAGDHHGAIATVTHSDLPAVACGACLLQDGEGGQTATALPEPVVAQLVPLLEDTLNTQASGLHTLMVDGAEIEVLLAILSPPPRILVLGAGMDAEPLVQLCASLGWRVSVQDHRPAYIDRGDFRLADEVSCHPVSDLSQALDLRRYDAAIVMSHHLLSDREYLRQLAPVALRYVGVLGPVQRRQRLESELKGQVPKDLRGPAGLDIGGRGPHAIALSIVAEMHKALA